MADNAIVKYSGDWALYNGAVAAGALLYVYDAGTTNLASIYTDNDLTIASANPVTADASGLLPFAWIGITEYKVKLTTSGGTLIDEQDNISGALNTAPFEAGDFAKPDQDMNAKTGNYTVVSGDLGTIINCDCSGGAFDITLMSAITATNGRGVTIRHVGTTATVGIVTVSSQTITSPTTGVTTTSFELTGYGETVTLVSDGANWHVTVHIPRFLRLNSPGVIQIADRVSAAPSSSPGSRYIVSAAFSTFEQEDIIEDNGQGGFIEITPPTDCGWIAYVQDEDRYYVFIGSAWVLTALQNINNFTADTNPSSDNDFLATYDASASDHKKISPYYVPGALIAIIEDQKAQNTAGGTFTSGADQTRVLNTLVYNRNSLASLASNQFTLPAGTWEIEWVAPAIRVDGHQSFLYSVTGTAEVKRGSSQFSQSGADYSQAPSVGSARVSVSSSTTYEIRHRCATTNADDGFGIAANFGTEVYTRVVVRRA